MSDEEIWAPIPGYDGMHEISTHGRVRSWVWGHGNTMIPLAIPKIRPLHKGGPRRTYLAVRLRWKGKQKTHAIHSTVLKIFRGKAPVGHECAHQDGDSFHNHLGNLFWKTRRQNHADKQSHGTQQKGESHPMAKLASEQVLMIRASKESCVAVAKNFGVSKSTVSAIRRGKLWRHL